MDINFIGYKFYGNFLTFCVNILTKINGYKFYRIYKIYINGYKFYRT